MELVVQLLVKLVYMMDIVQLLSVLEVKPVNPKPQIPNPKP